MLTIMTGRTTMLEKYHFLEHEIELRIEMISLYDREIQFVFGRCEAHREKSNPLESWLYDGACTRLQELAEIKMPIMLELVKLKTLKQRIESEALKISSESKYQWWNSCGLPLWLKQYGLFRLKE